MNESLTENQKLQLVELDSFVQSTDIELENILSSLGWKVENLNTVSKKFWFLSTLNVIYHLIFVII